MNELSRFASLRIPGIEGGIEGREGGEGSREGSSQR